ncbi:AraC family transcriptional regulator [Hydrogenovibrio kuenenii]|uniref:AraC family transcriptional regulator n=1 Tax=Hydrogenovibrio kuenenii TaxID=63658 RepID=UPI000467B3B5|nr:AraC family transcriptional regulator [Hydrogenovibrio kuenenii]
MTADLLTQLKALLVAEDLNEGLNQTAVPSVRVFKSSTITKPLQSVYEPALFVIVQGAKNVYLDQYLFEYCPQKYLLSTAFLPVTGQITEASPETPFLSLQIVFSVPKILEAVKEYSFQIEHKNHTDLAMGSNDITEELLEVVVRLAKLQQKTEDISALEDLYLKEILYRLLHSNDNYVLLQYAYSGGAAYQISKTISYINEHLFEDLSVDELAEYANMGVSTFHKHFKNMTQVSPLRYIKIQRLQHARKFMLLNKMNVTTASFQAGYQSASQFSRDYSAYFGINPREDVKHYADNQVAEIL